jgi:23S rRNA (cytidine1920-2'-O)/16S rRNA (cytidine1409-2'-O)-methyltransferase
MRLDHLLVEKGLFPSRTRAQAAIMAGIVFVNGQKAEKAGHSYPNEATIEIKGADHPYVGRGGLKLEAALKEFKLDPTGKTALDIGASTGGFTDCLLQHGAEKVFAVDVGYGQLDYKLRKDPRVVVIERTNARNLTLKELGLSASNISLCVIDVSFISLTKILPAAHSVIQGGAEVIALIKPQFEAKREQVGRGGIVKDEAVRQEVIEKVKTAASALGFTVEGLIRSPIEGADGNVEYLIHLVKGNVKS